MTSEDMQLVAKALCGYLPYGLKFRQTDESTITLKGLCIEGNIITVNPKMQYGFNLVNEYGDLEYKPYLRTMSSMTVEEEAQIQKFIDIVTNENYGDGYSPSAWDAMNGFVQYCDSRHLDHRGLIFRGLALEAPDGMYND